MPIDIEIQSSSSSYEIQAELNEQSSLASSTFSSEQAESAQKSFNPTNNQVNSRQNSTSSTLSRQNRQNQTSPTTVKREHHTQSEQDSANSNDIRGDKKNLAPAHNRLSRIVSEPGKKATHLPVQTNETMSLHESYGERACNMKNNYLNIENNYPQIQAKSNAASINLAKFRSSSPLEISPSSHSSSTTSNFNEFDEEKSASHNKRDKPANVSAANTQNKNQAIESNATSHGPLGDLQVITKKIGIYIFIHGFFSTKYSFFPGFLLINRKKL